MLRICNLISFFTFCLILSNKCLIAQSTANLRQNQNNFGLNVSLIGSYGINLSPSITYSLPKHKFAIGPMFMLIPEVGPSNYSQAAGNIFYNFYPFSQDKKWTPFLGFDLQGRKYKNYPALQNANSGNTDNFSVASFIFTFSPGFQRTLGKKMYLNFQIGAGYLYRWTLHESSNQYNQNEFSLFAKFGLGYNLKFNKAKDVQ